MRDRRRGVAVALVVACISSGCTRRSNDAEHSAPAPAPTATSDPDVRVRAGCPFEGCTYGRWTPRQPVPVYAAEGDTTRVAFTLPADRPVTAVRGNVHVRPGLAVAHDTLLAFASQTVSTRIAPGDTVVVLETVGEGTYNAELRGRPYQVEQFWGAARGTLVREARSQWWVLFRDDTGREAWGLVRRSDRFKGWDRLAGPE